MGWENLTSVSEFYLLGLSEQPKQQEILFGLFLSMYLVTVAGNLLIILAIIADAHLHTPMYFFLANLSLADACFVSTTVPKMLTNIWIQNQVISYAGCLSQLYFFMLFVMLEAFLLAVMAYNRYVDICHPLHYIMVMSPGLSVLLVSAPCIANALHSLLHTLLMNSLSFCADHKIPHYFCDINPLLSLSCTDPFINELVIFTIEGLAGPVCVLCLIISYTHIFLTILKIPSTQGKQKAFSTCSSHLSVISLFFGTSFCVYFSLPSTRSAEKGTVASVMYTVVTPVLNPFIYSLRNRDI
ncbi:olfactory receptor 1G1-like [Neomonachus schauinslandi]|uniref:Olfactory receptor n=1 Tax=Neomonachus schauinslandi TaxID=29088 RepID=A0A2Y9HAU6_NEOSC|nr:olfactory receptor 1G1-like [Neomonachus schauinslandi]